MISRIEELLRNNRAFVEQQLQLDPGYFDKLAEGQHPGFLWVGCSDSRVPPDRITGTSPGDMFVHRNIANLVVQTDMNFLSVLQYAVEVLQVQHVIVCGHYGCGGVKAAMGHEHHGLIDNWLRTVKDTQQYFWRELKDAGRCGAFRSHGRAQRDRAGLQPRQDAHHPGTPGRATSGRTSTAGCSTCAPGYIHPQTEHDQRQRQDRRSLQVHQRHRRWCAARRSLRRRR